MNIFKLSLVAALLFPIVAGSNMVYAAGLNGNDRSNECTAFRRTNCDYNTNQHVEYFGGRQEIHKDGTLNDNIGRGR